MSASQNWCALSNALTDLKDCSLTSKSYQSAVRILRQKCKQSKQYMIERACAKQSTKDELASSLSHDDGVVRTAKELKMSVGRVKFCRIKAKLPDDFWIKYESAVIAYQLNDVGNWTFLPIYPVSEMSIHQMVTFLKQTLKIISDNVFLPNNGKQGYLIGGSPKSIFLMILKIGLQHRSGKAIVKSVDIKLHDILNEDGGPYTLGYEDEDAIEQVQELARYTDKFCKSRLNWVDKNRYDIL